MKRFSIFAPLLFFSIRAFAEGYSGPTVPSMSASSNGIEFIYLPVSLRGSGTPACATYQGGSYFRFAVSITTDAGKAIYAALTAAAIAGLQVEILGTGACDIQSDTETIMTISY
jgi:hypothetical protein